MATPSESILPDALPCAVNGRSIETLWLLRLLVRTGATRILEDTHAIGTRNQLLNRLGLAGFPARPNKELTDSLRILLSTTLNQMEARVGRYVLPRVLASNLSLLARHFPLSATEQEVLAFALLLKTNPLLASIAHASDQGMYTQEAMEAVLRRRATAVRNALAKAGRLQRAGLMRIEYGWPLPKMMQIVHHGLLMLVRTRVTKLEKLLNGVFCEAPAATLQTTDYTHFQPQLDVAIGLIRDAVQHHRIGVNLLIYGPPGTGKTELSRTLAKAAGVACANVSSSGEGGEPLDNATRLANTAIAQRMLERRRTLLVFDEVDALFNDGSSFIGKPSTAETSKSWVNALLEETPVPTVWIANRIHGMDPAFLRRFDLVAKLSSPSLDGRLKLLKRTADGLLTENQALRIARCGTLTPAAVTRAANVARHVASVDIPAAIVMETVLNGVLRARCEPTVARSNTHHSGNCYDPTLCNADHDLLALADGLAHTGIGRICLSGPPGTGKTAFGHWLSERLNRPLLLKRVSDIQSPLLGVMEQQLADTFEESSRSGSILQIDEIDGFLRDRREARYGWEVTQVNEFLTQLEAFDGIFIGTTNLAHALDAAALRRFDLHVRICAMRLDQVMEMLKRWLADVQIAMPDNQTLKKALDELDGITPGDLAQLQRRHRIAPVSSIADAVTILRQTLREKGQTTRKIGFV
ncbi:MAG: hypothetical protein CVV05_19580 [Gammaproteobacteria bacterium HGW-Gammaproteobacteria-1]|nr:MAG: hypothetical protein CVV12_05090 [Gammaproteobacteria bacterium HGW-Gammaproteobacteria-2]PKM42083.1 MAG: hypothetical protein CVV05_19580 [Gammaproteobacteria bacterium HGW-Gammaproteobacteria-1]